MILAMTPSRLPHHLLLTRRFLPLFVTQLLGAFTGNLFKNATIVLIIFRLDGGGATATVAAGLFVLPFVLFSATAGQLADRFDKARLIRLTKLAELAIAAVAVVALWSGRAWMLDGVLFLFGLQATVFGPLKYGILPDHLAPGELLAANGLVEAGTFVAILAGTIAGSGLILDHAGLAAALLLAAAGAGWAASLWLPPAPSTAPGLAVDFNPLRQSWRLLAGVARRPEMIRGMLGISWFWLVGATYLTQFATFVRDVLAAEAGLVPLFLAMFTLGISFGSLLCNRLSGGVVTLRLCAWGAIGMGVFGLDFALAAAPGAFWRLLADLLLTAMAGGLFVVPLYAFLQTRAEAAERARVIAANNILNALLMTLGAGLAAALLSTGVGLRWLLAVTAAANLLLGIIFLSRRSAPPENAPPRPPSPPGDRRSAKSAAGGG